MNRRLVLVQRLCNKVSEVSIDSTFKCGAKFFLKKYNIHGLCIGHYVPFCVPIAINCLENQFTMHVECYKIFFAKDVLNP